MPSPAATAASERPEPRQEVTRVRLSPDARVRISEDPYTAVLAVACAGVRDLLARRRSPVARLTAHLAPEQRRAVARVAAPGGSVSPDFLSPPWPALVTHVPDEVGRLRDLSAHEIESDFASTFGDKTPTRWQPVTDHPREWVHHLAAAISRLWGAVEPVWQREQQLRDAEADRVGAATVRGAFDTVLGALHPRGWAEGDMLVFPDPEGTEIDARGRDVILAPGLSRLDVSISNLERPDAVWLAYPTRGEGFPDPVGLTALLTPIRAKLLQLLSSEMTMSETAQALGVTPATATHQVDALVVTGLALRRRDGRRVMVRRSERGDGILRLYALGTSVAPD
jgi:DNA-binding transcriptional ArsR family regulator